MKTNSEAFFTHRNKVATADYNNVLCVCVCGKELMPTQKPNN
jgi:hypothetical protein